jgi:hypothetical protein
MFRSSTIIRELVLSLAKAMLEHYVPIGYVVVWQHVLGVACVLCAEQNETELGGVELRVKEHFVTEYGVKAFGIVEVSIHSFVTSIPRCRTINLRILRRRAGRV